MNRPIIKYSLLIITLLIWGLIGWRVFAYLNPEVPELSIERDEIILEKEQLAYITPSLSLSYEDPFLKNEPEVKKLIKQKKKETDSIIDMEPVKQLLWPELVYLGMFKNKKTGKVSASIKTGENYSLLNLNDKLESCQITIISADSIVLEQESELKSWFRK